MMLSQPWLIRVIQNHSLSDASDTQELIEENTQWYVFKGEVIEPQALTPIRIIFLRNIEEGVVDLLPKMFYKRPSNQQLDFNYQFIMKGPKVIAGFQRIVSDINYRSTVYPKLQIIGIERL